jgi:hypothetical protein
VYAKVTRQALEKELKYKHKEASEKAPVSNPLGRFV